MSRNNSLTSMLADPQCRAIIFAIVEEPLTTEEISIKTKIASSVTYRKINLLMGAGIVIVHSFEHTGTRGGKSRKYLSRIIGANIEINGLEPQVKLIDRIARHEK